MRGFARRTSGPVCFLIICIFILASCGGGGDAGSGGISYSGESVQASITDSNADEISSGALQGGGTGTLGGVASLGEGAADTQAGQQLYLMVSRVLEKVVRSKEPSSAGDARAVVSDTVYIYGDCAVTPGVAAFYENFNTLTGSYYGSIYFSSFCYGGYTYSGNASFSGQLDLDTFEIRTLYFALSNVVLATPCGDSHTVSGGISYDFTSDPVSVGMSLLMKETGSQVVFWLEDLDITLKDYGSYVDEAFTGGRFYHPDYGFVTYASQIPFRFYAGSDWPSNGVLVLTGADAGGGPTRARLTVLSDTQYRVEADTDGDGLYEYDSGVIDWDTACE